MEWFIAVGAIVLMAILIVGLFHGPSHDHRPHRGSAKAAPEPPPSEGEPAVAPLAVPPLATTEAPINPHAEPPAYTLPPPAPRRRFKRPVGRPGGRRI